MPNIRTDKKSFPNRLQKAITSWQKFTEPILAKRMKMLQYYSGGYFDDTLRTKKHILNLTARGVDIIAPYLVMSNPGVMVDSRVPQLRPWAHTTKLALEHLFEEIDFAELSLRPAIINSMFGMGITKTGIMKAAEAEYAGYLHDIGQPYCDTIDDADYVGDVSARTREAFEFEGHRYRLPTEFAKQFFGPKHADNIKPDFSLHGMDHPETIVKRDKGPFLFDSLYEWSEFYDIWLPREDIVITIQPEGRGSHILRTVEWDGPEGGPYDVLKYKFFPSSPIPIPPVWFWLLMDTMVNILVNKMRHQAEREKTFLAYEASAKEDAEGAANISDGGTLQVDNIDAMKEITYGGVNEENYKWVDYIEHQFSLQGGNLYTIGGRTTQAETLGQEQMMFSNASKILDDMMNQVYKFTQKITKKLAWFMWTDPLIQIPVIKRIPGVGDLSVIFDQTDKEGDFYDFNFKIKPYSMQRMSPIQRQQLMFQFLTAWVIPILPLAAQQGAMLDVNAATKDMSELLDLNTDHWWKSATPVNADAGPYQPTQGKVSSGQGDDRFGASPASRQGNLNQYEKSTRANKPSPPNKKKG